MDQLSRRRVLAGLAGLTTLTGCNATQTLTDSERSTPTQTASGTPTPTDTPHVTASETPTPAPVTVSDLEFVGSVVRQPTESKPGRIRASLTNHGDRPLTVSTGGLLPLGARPDDGSGDALLLYADQSDAINEYGWEDPDPGGFSYDGCWHAPGKMFRTSMAAMIDLPVGLSLVTEYTPLAGPDADCPAGTYTGQQELTLRKSEQTLTVEISITADADGRFSVSGSHTLEGV